MTSLIIFCCTSMLAVTIAAPNGVYVGKGGVVGASWGGYSASAGLGGPGGLHASAGTPDNHYAAAGIGGEAAAPPPAVVSSGSQASSSASASATAGSVGASAGNAGAGTGTGSFTGTGTVVLTNGHNSFFDNIFNIPISVLKSVNQYLNNRKAVSATLTASVGAGNNVNAVPVQVPVYPVKVHHHHAHVKVPVVKVPVVPVAEVPVQASNSQASSSSSASASASASSSASSSSNAGSGAFVSNGIAGGNVQHGVYYTKGHTRYDDIFNIPISVLGAVNRLLNNGK